MPTVFRLSVAAVKSNSMILSFRGVIFNYPVHLFQP